MRAGFFVDVTAKAQRPISNTRFIIASAHCAHLYEAFPCNENLKRWRLCTLLFNSYFKVMDLYRYRGVTQILLLHIPYQAIPFFMGDHSFNFIQGVSQINIVEIARKNLESKMQMEVFADTSEPALMERMKMPPCLNEEGAPQTLDFMLPIPQIETWSHTVRRMAEDLAPINYPDGMIPK